MGPLLGVCPRPPGSLPAGLTLESEPSHLRPETAAAHLDHTPRTVCRPPAGPCKGPPASPRHAHLCLCPRVQVSLSLPSLGAAPGAWGQRHRCPGWGGVRLTGSWRCQNWPAELPAGLLDTVTQAGRSHVVPVAGVCPGATSCRPRWLWTPGRAPYLGRVPPSGGGGAGPALWPQGSSAPPANPTPGPGLAPGLLRLPVSPPPWGCQSPQPRCPGLRQGDSVRPWPASPLRGRAG